MKRTFISLAIFLASLSLYAAPKSGLPKEDQDSLHNFFTGINNLIDGIDIAEGDQYDKPPVDAQKIAGFLKGCKITDSDDSTTNSSTTTFTGISCPMAYNETTTDADSNPDVIATTVRAELYNDELIGIAGVTSFIQNSSAKTAAQANGQFHTDETSNNSYSVNTANSVTISDTIHVDGTISKNNDEVAIEITHLNAGGSIQYGSGKTALMSLILDTKTDGTSTAVCTINQSVADCVQLAYILALDNQTELVDFLTERITDNLKEKSQKKKLRSFGGGDISNEDQSFLHNFFIGAHNLDGGIGLILQTRHEKVSTGAQGVAARLQTCKVLNSIDSTNQTSTAEFTGETCPIGFSSNSATHGTIQSNSAQFTTCDSNIQALTGIAREAYKFESDTKSDAGIFQTTTASTTRYATSTNLSVIVTEKIQMAGADSNPTGSGSLSLTSFSAETDIIYGSKNVTLTSMMDHSGAMVCAVDGKPIDCLKLNYILDMNAEQIAVNVR